MSDKKWQYSGRKEQKGIVKKSTDEENPIILIFSTRENYFLSRREKRKDKSAE